MWLSGCPQSFLESKPSGLELHVFLRKATPLHAAAKLRTIQRELVQDTSSGGGGGVVCSRYRDPCPTDSPETGANSGFLGLRAVRPRPLAFTVRTYACM